MDCAACGASLPADSRFCNVCGEPVRSTTPSAEVRKVVTVIFCDVVGSTSLGERLDPEPLRRVLSRYFELMTSVIERHGGTVEKYIGDAVMAVFGVPTVHEDDALRAVRAAAEMRDELHDLNKELERDEGTTLTCRIGVHTGEVVTGEATDRQALVTGDAVNVAARLEQTAPPGEVVISEDTRRLVADAVSVDAVGDLTLKGKAQPVPGFRLHDVRPGAAGVSRRLDAPLVGRARQLAQFTQAFRDATDMRACHLFTVLGEPGSGKTRLVQEACARVSGDATVAWGRCLAYGDGMALWPLIQAVRGALEQRGIEPGVVAEHAATLFPNDLDGEPIVSLIAQLLGEARREASDEDIAWAVRRFLEGISRTRPLVLVLDDTHWAEDKLLDLIEQLAAWTHDAPILLVCAARPELLERRPEWAGGQRHATTVDLEPLSEAECDTLLAHLLEGGRLSEAPREHLLKVAEGNPLFLEQTLAMLVDDGLLTPEDGRWTLAAELDPNAIPPSVQALLSARLDRLDDLDRRVLNCGSVIGQVFYVDAIAALDPSLTRSDVVAALQRMGRRDLVRPERSDLPGEDAFRFWHYLLQEAAYRMVPMDVRATLHESLADWLGARHGEDVDVFVGHHLERAAVWRRTAAPHDPCSQRLAVRAADALSSAARRNRFQRVSLLTRSLALRSQGDRRRPSELLELAQALMDFEGDFKGADSAVREALRAARSAGDASVEREALLMQGIVSASLEPSGARDRVDEALRRVGADLHASADTRARIRAYEAEALVAGYDCRQDAAYEANLRASQLAAAVGDTTNELSYRGGALESALIGARTPADLWPEVESFAMAVQVRLPSLRVFERRVRAVLSALVGDLAQAQAFQADAESTAVANMGHVGAATLERGWMVATLAREDDLAYSRIAGLHRRVAEGGNRGGMSTAAGEWARSSYRLARFDEAWRHAEECRSLTDPGDSLNFFLWPPVEAMLLAREARFDDAEPLLRLILQYVERTDVLVYQAWALHEAAEAFRLAGRVDDARTMLRKALEVAERKQSAPQIDQIRRDIAGIR